MINVFKKIWDFAYNEHGNIKKSIGLGLLNAIFHALQLYAIFAVLAALVNGNPGKNTALIAVGLMLVSIVGKIVTQYYSQLQRVHAGYFMAADKRIQIGDKLKVVPMGYFNQNSLGNITAVATTTLSEVETTAPVVLVTTLGGFINAVVFAIVILLFDWRIGLLVVAAMLLFLWVTSMMEKRTRRNAPLRQAAQEKLVESALETIQGMSVVKAFNLSRDKNKRMDQAIDNSCTENASMEKSMSPYLWLQSVILDLFSVGIMLLSVYFYLQGTMPLAYCLLLIVAAFMIFGELKSAGSGMATLRLTEVSIDRANELDHVPVMSEGSIDTAPASYGIEFQDVRFAYEKRTILDGVSFKIPDRTMTAIVGPSGSGKTTLCNLIARAMLKDAPIVIFDEATANVDPENEDRLQTAIEELTKNKTIIMIAHRLKTVRNADQILVVNGGKIVQQGKHDDLIRQKGIYADFVSGRKQAIGWKLNAN